MHGGRAAAAGAGPATVRALTEPIGATGAVGRDPPDGG
jgi:hypothetical protein